MASPPETSVGKSRLVRCMDWLQKQNSLDSKKLSQQNKNDIQFIIQTNADRKNFLLSAAEDEATVPEGVNEPSLEPKAVPLRRLRIEQLRLECEWQECHLSFSDYEKFQKHIREHSVDLQVIEKDDSVECVCLWDVCGYKTSDFNEMVRHINYHAYHARLLAIGFNGRATLQLARCKKDSSKRNQLPPLKCDHACLWVGCEEKFTAIQDLFDHVKLHINYAERLLCSWCGCGMTFTRRSLLAMHARSHTGERLIACYHCGQHFACNRKLCDHLRRQNVYPNSCYSCTVCGVSCATEYLLREHARQHVSAYACALCDMSAPSPAALAQHVRYRHLPRADARAHACPHCEYRAVSRSDLRKHIPTHTRKRKRLKTQTGSDADQSDEENSETEKKCPKPRKKYACHMCPEKSIKIFSRGSRLTTHLVKVHGAQWPFGHSRFRYQISEDGMYRLTTTRYEVLEVSKQIVDGYSGPKESLKTSFEFNVRQVADATRTAPRRIEITLKASVYKLTTPSVNGGIIQNACDTYITLQCILRNAPRPQPLVQSEQACSAPVQIVDGYSGPKESLKTSFEFNVRQVADATRTAPRRIEITLKGESDEETPMKTEKVEPAEDPAVEITMCDVDEEGNIISSAVISETVYS